MRHFPCLTLTARTWGLLVSVDVLLGSEVFNNEVVTDHIGPEVVDTRLGNAWLDAVNIELHNGEFDV